MDNENKEWLFLFIIIAVFIIGLVIGGVIREAAQEDIEHNETVSCSTTIPPTVGVCFDIVADYVLDKRGNYDSSKLHTLCRDNHCVTYVLVGGSTIG